MSLAFGSAPGPSFGALFSTVAFSKLAGFCGRPVRAVEDKMQQEDGRTPRCRPMKRSSRLSQKKRNQSFGKQFAFLKATFLVSGCSVAGGGGNIPVTPEMGKVVVKLQGYALFVQFTVYRNVNGTPNKG